MVIIICPPPLVRIALTDFPKHGGGEELSILVRIGLTDLPKHGGEESSLRFLRFGGVGGHSIGLASKIVGIFFKSTYVSGIINQILRNVHKYAVQNIFHLNLPCLTRPLKKTPKTHLGQLLQASKRLTGCYLKKPDFEPNRKIGAF